MYCILILFFFIYLFREKLNESEKSYYLGIPIVFILIMTTVVNIIYGAIFGVIEGYQKIKCKPKNEDLKEEINEKLAFSQKNNKDPLNVDKTNNKLDVTLKPLNHHLKNNIKFKGKKFKYNKRNTSTRVNAKTMSFK